MTSPSGCSGVPPGFRFHPTDEELLYYYLKKKVSYEKIEIDVIRDVDLNKLEPWDLHERCRIGSTPQNEWYFFSHKDRKYPTGSRTNRATAAGFWKATGRDKAIHTEFKRIGMRKTLVFYKGRAPRGQKTNWIMHEYRLEENDSAQGNEDGWVVCRVFKKRNHAKGHDSDPGSNLEENSSALSEPKDGPEEDPQCIISQQQQQNYIYKPELPMQYNIANPHHSEQIMQMTQLEGKELLLMDSCNSAPDHISLGTKRFFPERVIESVAKRIHYQLPLNNNNNNNNNFLDMGPPATTTDTARQLKEIREEQLNDWAVLDRFVASHLNHEDSSSKEIRYHVGAAAELNAPPGDHVTQLPLRGDQIDLWNFGK